MGCNKRTMESPTNATNKREIIMYSLMTYERKPSKPTLVAAIRKALNNGADFVQLVWGENQITIEKTQWGLSGHGWIGKNGGHDLALLFRMK
jgi:hypothetical protein